MASDFATAFAQLRDILKKHCDGMVVQEDTPTDFTVVCRSVTANNKPLWFGCVLMKKSGQGQSGGSQAGRHHSTTWNVGCRLRSGAPIWFRGAPDPGLRCAAHPAWGGVPGSDRQHAQSPSFGGEPLIELPLGGFVRAIDQELESLAGDRLYCGTGVPPVLGFLRGRRGFQSSAPGVL